VTAHIDDARTACLCDQGLPGWHAATCVAEDGCHDLVLANAEWVGDGRYTYDPTTPQAPHEQPGPLPPRWRDRVQLAPLRCGRRTKSGTSCRTYVARPGDACGWHREQNTLDRDERTTR
jgi:hypothetical protein